MSIIKLEFDVDKPLLEVWNFGLDTARIPEWQFDISAVKNATGSIVGLGYAYTLVYHMWGRDFASPVHITRFDPPHAMETSGRTPIGGFFRSATRMLGAGLATHIAWQMEYQLPLGFLGKVLDLLLFHKAFERTVRKYNDNFKAVAEGKPPPHPNVSRQPNPA